MSDTDGPDNVVSLPRIGSPPPPPVPSPPTLNQTPAAPDTAPATVRISAFDAPAVPHAPSTVPAALRSDGLDPVAPDPNGLPPRTGALSLAAILAIALAAFEGVQTWLQESGPRRAEAAKHEREMELLAAKARADATRLGAEAGKEHARSRRVPSSHDYGRSALGRGSGGPGRGGGGIGSGRSGTGRTGPYSGSAHGRGNGGTGRTQTSRSDGSAGAGTGSGRNGGPSSRNGATGNRNGGAPDRNGSLRGRNGASGGGGAGSGRGGASGGGSSASGRSGASDDGGRRSARQAVADWWGKGRKSPGGSGGSGTPGPGGSGAGKGRSPKSPGGGTDRKAAIRNAVKAARTGPTAWDSLGDRLKDRWKTRRNAAAGGQTQPGNGGWTPPGDRTTFREAVFKTMSDRWKKRRQRWNSTGGPRHKPRPRRNPGASNGPTSKPGPSTGPAPGGPGPSPGGPGPSSGSGYGEARSSPFDADTGPDVTITWEQVDPPGAHAKRWQPTAIGPRQQALPKRGAPALPRAPQRPAGQRPGTTRRKDPIPMPPVPARTAGVPAPVSATVSSPGGLSPQHATDINLDKALQVLTALTTAGMETHDESADLAKQARRLLSELESMANDLVATHNVQGPRTLHAVSVLMESVAQLVAGAERMARAALDAAELSEAEETAMARDYRPVQDATADAGLAAPSARIHNEN
ncbi:hypothetical protein [Streptomyces flaveolus]|uniref:Uncharacterized protein n=1 Tax=Streptomyces flaveolus TaxID=67297 RepID=A0ABV3APV2_9ACTN